MNKPNKPVVNEYRRPGGGDPYAEGGNAAKGNAKAGSPKRNPYRPGTESYDLWEQGYREAGK